MAYAWLKSARPYDDFSRKTERASNTRDVLVYISAKLEEGPLPPALRQMAAERTRLTSNIDDHGAANS